MKKTFFIAFIVLALIQLAMPVKMIWDKESAMTRGREYKFRTTPIDPYDPFRGRYVTLRFDVHRYLPKHKLNVSSGDPVYVQLTTDTAGFAIIDTVYTSLPPSNGRDYVKGVVSYAYADQILIAYPFDKFYMEEGKAPEAERKYAEANRRATPETAWALVSVFEGEGVLKDVLVDGISLRQLAASR